MLYFLIRYFYLYNINYTLLIYNDWFILTWDSDIDSVTLAYPIIFVDGVEIGDEDMAKIDTADVVSINILKDGPIYDLVAPRTGKIVMVKTKSKIFLKQWLLRKQFIDDMYKRKQEKTHQKGIVIR